MDSPKNTLDWTLVQVDYLEDNYGFTSFVELAKALSKDPEEIRAKVKEMDLAGLFIVTENSTIKTKLAVRQLMQDNKRFLPNGWLVGLSMGHSMLRSLCSQINEGDTWLEEVEEELNSVLDALVQLFELSPLLTVGDMLKGEDVGQAYRITGREFRPAQKEINYYLTYLYGSEGIPEEYDDEDEENEDPLHQSS
ncbi:hypothetical protein [Spirosoma flavum]|uniref:Uncharacterized protein n=1 Tax=Spirosoma flavum TaxID=2048557 RepID=A0ABW6ASY5_9BACT